MTDQSQSNENEKRRDRKFAVSSNRGKASHRLRYVETGGAAVDTEDCTFCQVTPDLSDTSAESSAGDEKSSPCDSKKDASD